MCSPPRLDVERTGLECNVRRCNGASVGRTNVVGQLTVDDRNQRRRKKPARALLTAWKGCRSESCPAFMLFGRPRVVAGKPETVELCCKLHWIVGWRCGSDALHRNARQLCCVSIRDIAQRTFLFSVLFNWMLVVVLGPTKTERTENSLAWFGDANHGGWCECGGSDSLTTGALAILTLSYFARLHATIWVCQKCKTFKSCLPEISNQPPRN